MREAGFVADNKKLAEVMGEKSITKDTLEGYIGYHYIVDTNLYLPWLRHQLTEMAHRFKLFLILTLIQKKRPRLNQLFRRFFLQYEQGKTSNPHRCFYSVTQQFFFSYFTTFRRQFRSYLLTY